LKLSQEEWRQIEYLLWITQLFFQFTTAVSKTKDVTIHSVFSIYNKLFDHLETSMAQLRRKKVPWKQVMLKALEAARLKLDQYYSMTDHMPGDLFAIGTILAPQNKLHFFSDKDWEDPKIDYCEKYCKSLQDYLRPYQQRISDTQLQSRAQSSAIQTSHLDMLLTPRGLRQPALGQYDELTQYLSSGKYIFHPSFPLTNLFNRYSFGCSPYLLERPST
jgi:hypothetical protein